MSKVSPLEELVGQVFEKRYRILEPLGEGGMGAVFLGEHVVIGRQVAIKVLHSRLGESKDFASRFAREAVAAGRLDHPNCVPVTDSGQLEDGTAYLVMELVKGTSLGSLLNENPSGLDPVRALRIIRHVLRGLGHAHAVGIVHRDIKPDNIMLTEREDDPDFARILDFGIAKLRDDDNKANEALTQAGMSVGTPSYLSPEQALGEEVDHRSDLYSATVLLFEMLSGRPPFTAPNPVGILTKHATAPVPHIWDVAPYLSDYIELDELIQRGLAKLRDQRYADAAEYVEAIDRVLLLLGSQLTPLPMASEFSGTNPVMTASAPREITGPAYPPPTNSAATTALPHVTGQPPLTHATGQSALTELPRATTSAGAPASSQGKLRNGLIAAAGVSVVLALILVMTGSSDKSKPAVAPINKEALLAEYRDLLKHGKTCEKRLVAVRLLAQLQDKRAIPDLKRARRRMTGGVLGIGAKNKNRCLRKAAQKAIKSLQAASK